MKKFLIKGLLFSLPIFLMAYWADVVISSDLRHSNKYAEKELPTWNAVFDGKVDSDLLIYGSSRAWVHYNPMMITERTGILSYNFGVDGSNIFLQYLRHQLSMKYNKKPKQIIYSVDMFTVQKKTEIFNWVQFLPYALWNKDIEATVSQFSNYNFYDYYIPLVRYYGQYEAVEKALRYRTGHLSNPIGRVRGYMGRDEKWNADFDKAKAKMKKYKIVVDSKAVALFEKFIDECRQNHIQLTFVYPPEYIEGQQFIENRREVMELYHTISEKYKIPFFDYTHDALSYDKRYFYNANHLNKTGSELFTSKLIDTLVNAKILIPNKIKVHGQN